MNILQNPHVARAWEAFTQAAAQVPDGTIRLVKNSLNGGELSKGMAARFDQQRFQTGCHELLNFCPLPCGGVTKRPGLQHMGASGQSSDAYAARLVPFVFSTSESRMLEFYEAANNTVWMAVWTSGGTNLGVKLSLPWAKGTLANVSFAQSGDVIFCASANFKPARIERHSDSEWEYHTINWLPSIGAPTIASLTEEGENSGSKVRLWYQATAVDAATGEEGKPGAPASILATSLTSSHTVKITLQAVVGASEYRIYKRSAGVYGFIGRITEGLEFVDSNIAADTEDTPPDFQDPFSTAWSYPTVVFLHQQRLGFASSRDQPLTVWLTQTGNLGSMARSLPPKADDAIEATLAACEANRILWCQSDRSGLAIGTEGGEWLLQSGEGAALTPNDLSFQPQTYYGSQPGVPVLRAGSSLLYAGRGGCAIREFGYSFTEDRYQSTDLSLLARHILEGNPVVAWAWQPEPYGIIWCALYDGTLAGLTYLREHEVVGWHRHVTEGGWIETLAAIPGADGATQVWALVFRQNGNTWTRRVERLRPFDGETSTSLHEDGSNKVPVAARLIPCFGEVQDQTGMTQGLVRKINTIKAHVMNCGPLACHIESQDEPAGPWHDLNKTFKAEALTACHPQGGWRENPKAIITSPDNSPATILGIFATLEFATQLGGKK